MIIHCLSCGKSVSSNLHRCPYCMVDISEIAIEINSVESKQRLRERMKGLMFGFVHK